MTNPERLRQATRLLNANPTHYIRGCPCVIAHTAQNVHVIALVEDGRVYGSQIYGSQGQEISELTPIPPEDWQEPLAPGPYGEPATVTPHGMVRSGRWRFQYVDKDGTVATDAALAIEWNDLVQRWAAATIPSAHASDMDLRAVFDFLKDQWMRETEMLSDIAKKCVHPAYQKIIGLGMPAVRLILEEFRVHGGHWHWALAAITRHDPAADAGTHGDGIRAAWIRWGIREEIIVD